MQLAFGGEVLRYGGTVFPGFVAICADEMKHGPFAGERFERFCTWAGRRGQEEWRSAIMRLRADEPLLGFAAAAAACFRREWRKELGAEAPPELRFKAFADGKAWCDQCDMAVTEAEASGCKSRY